MLKRAIASITGILIVLTNLIVLSAPSQASGFRSTYGTDFWVHWDENFGGATEVPSLSLAGTASGTATITWPDGSQETATITEGQVTGVDATAAIKTAGKYVTGTDLVGTFAARVQTTVPINLYLSNLRSASSDASIAYPTSYLGQTYRVFPPPNVQDLGPERFSVTAAEEGATTVTVTLVAGSTNTGGKTPGTPYTVQLNQGQTYTFTGGELAGSLIQADKKVVVSSSIECANFTPGFCDHVTEFMPPVETWGVDYIVPASRNVQNDDLTWILAHEDGTQISVNGGAPIALSAGQNYVIPFGSSAQAVGYRTVSSNKPVLVVQGLRAGSYSSSAGTQTGDPAIVLIQPTVQFLNDAVFSTPATGFPVNYVTLVANTTEVNNGSLKLDGVSVTPSDFTPVTGTPFSIGRLDIAVGTHSVSSTSGFAAYVTGFGNANSYAYSGGSGLVDLVQNPGGVAQVGYQSVEEISQGGSSGDVSRDVERETVISYDGPIVTTDPTAPASDPGTKKRFGGTKHDEITKVVIDGKEVKFTIVNGQLEIEVPEGLSSGTYNMTVSGTFGSLVVQDALTIAGAATLDIGKKTWTNINSAKTSVRVIYKNPVGVGKVQFMLNGREFAWVRATDGTDPKLRNYTLDGIEIPYLVRNVVLTPGIKNAFEIYVDGKRVWRAAYYSAD